MEKFTVITAAILLVAQIFVLYLTIKMYRFAKQYSKEWSRAFVTFFVGMSIVFLRRVIVVVWGLGVDGTLMKIIEWVDHIVITAILTFIWGLFLYQLSGWWGKFFKEYLGFFPRNEKINLELAQPKEVFVEKPTRVSVGERLVVVEGVEKVIVVEPKKVNVLKEEQ